MSSLLADIGGTNARFALLSNGALGPIHRHDVHAYSGIATALRSFLNEPREKAGMRPRLPATTAKTPS